MPVTPLVFAAACPRCKASRFFIGENGGQLFTCGGCEWDFVTSAVLPAGALSGAHAAGLTALTFATPAAPAIPATGVAATNSNAYTILVTVSGGTMTGNTLVNGVSAGAADGTFTVPAGQTITISYSVAPSWTLAAPGTLFTSGMAVLIDSGTNAEVVTAGAGATATNVPVTALLKAHASAVLAGRLAVNPQFTQAGTELVPAAPGWGF